MLGNLTDELLHTDRGKYFLSGLALQNAHKVKINMSIAGVQYNNVKSEKLWNESNSVTNQILLTIKDTFKVGKIGVDYFNIRRSET